MALSNWDTLAFGHDGKPNDGSFDDGKGNSVDLYKNWLYVRSEKMWYEGYQYIKPTIAQIGEGDLTLAGFEIHACRGPQNAVFAVVSFGPWDDRKYSGGIGCYGFVDIVEKVLREKGRLAELNDGDWCSGSSHYTDENGVAHDDHHISNMKTGEQIVHEHDSAEWVGCLPSTLAEYWKWVERIAEYDDGMKQWMERCKAEKPLRFNQGDAYFADHLGIPLDATEPGEITEKPILMQMFAKEQSS